jgi:hypothetical protein
VLAATIASQGFWERRWEQKERVQDAAFVAHHIHRENAANVYANTRRVAGIMTAFEDDDYKLQVSEGSLPLAVMAKLLLVRLSESKQGLQYDMHLLV